MYKLKNCPFFQLLLDNYLVFKIGIIILLVCNIDMEEISKCECPPGSDVYENEDGMLICVSCKGWVEY